MPEALTRTEGILEVGQGSRRRTNSQEDEGKQLAGPDRITLWRWKQEAGVSRQHYPGVVSRYWSNQTVGSSGQSSQGGLARNTKMGRLRSRPCSVIKDVIIPFQLKQTQKI